MMVAITAPATMINAIGASPDVTIRTEGVILSYPWIERHSKLEKVAADVRSSAAKEPQQEAHSDNQPTSQSGAQSTGALASRGGMLTAAPPKPSYADEDVYWLSRIISAEAKGESMEGQIAVGAVVMNRVHNPRYPKTIKAVVFANGQFDPVRDGSINSDPVPSAVEAAKHVLQGENPVPEAYYFYNPSISTDQWIRSLRVIKRIGNHVFAAST